MEEKPNIQADNNKNKQKTEKKSTRSEFKEYKHKKNL